MKKKIRIGFDMDDILCETVKGFIKHKGGKLNGADLNYKELTDFNLETIPEFNITKKEVVRLFDEYILNHALNSDMPTRGIKTLIRSLKKIFDPELYVITARSSHLYGVTEQWIENHFKGLFKGIFLTDFNGINSKNKSEICKHLGLDLFIDDGHHNCHDIAVNAGIKSYLYTRPRNKKHTELHPNIIRFNSWKDLFHKLSHEHNH